MEVLVPTHDELIHYGVKGMKWGVRKSNRPDGVSGKTYRTAKKRCQGICSSQNVLWRGSRY